MSIIHYPLSIEVFSLLHKKKSARIASSTPPFKQQIKLIGKETDSIITTGSMVLGKNELNAVTPSYQGALLKSVMKQLDIDSNVDIPLNSVLNYKFGVKVNGEYEYLDFGNYVVYKVEKQEDTRSYNITCYDKMLYSMVEYKADRVGIKVRHINPAYTSQTCSKCGHIDKENRQTQEKFKCTKCGLELNADHNASINIARSEDFIK